MAIRPPFALLAAVVVALAAGAPATAKELTRVAICGLRDVCVSITDAKRLSEIPTGGATSVAAPPVQPFYVMTLRIEHGDDAEEGGVYYLRDANVLAANGVEPGRLVWLPISDRRARSVMRDLTRAIEPHPAPPAWPPHGLKSTYRVIPDDEITLSEPAATPEPVPASRDGIAARWVGAAVGWALALAAAALLLRRLASHQPRDQIGQALALEDTADAFGER